MPKSAQAFRTIREVADWLDVAAHVLRFWESKFNQIKPVKRAGGRRYYRPADMELVGGIKVLLHDRGMTIRGVQKLIADEGLEAVTSLSPSIDELVEDAEVVELDASDVWDEDAAAESEEAQEADEAVSIDAPEPEQSAPPAPEPDHPIPDHPISSEPEITAPEAAPIPEDAPLPDAAPAPEEAPAFEEAAAVAEAAPTPEEDTEDTPAEPEAAPVKAPLPTAAPSPEPTAPAIASAAVAVQIPPADPAEGALGALAALSQLPGPQRAVLRPQIMALAKLRDRMSSGATIG
ncbi:MerR family transcriptional regulator [Rhodobacteraceae bacterium N5(2021)]|uniref:MerR family transcriptional regulator n=1 Tax=Gymnodinialimonas phycosphaerae TaxID=2841589 RepID=A0A975TVP7_9RHOB|nr:MerR family transcriptional regulator [Gymnodinialimonas phycosphaerae]MBY4891578.1 MerR family transcriptional regulator [Gymnodinialimonas phycosphaerae]